MRQEEVLDSPPRYMWYIDVPGQFTEIYRAGSEIEVAEGFDKVLSGENILPGFTFNLE